MDEPDGMPEPNRYAFGRTGKLYRLSNELVVRDYDNPYIVGSWYWKTFVREAMRPEGATAFLLRNGDQLEPSAVVALRFGGVVKWYVRAGFNPCKSYYNPGEFEHAAHFLFPIPWRTAEKAVARFRGVAAYAGSSLLDELQPRKEWFDMQEMVREGLAELVDEHAGDQPASLLRAVMAFRPMLGRYMQEMDHPEGWVSDKAFDARTLQERPISHGYERARWVRKEPTPTQKRLVGPALHQLTFRQRACAPFEEALCSDLRRHIYGMVARDLVKSKGKLSLWDVLYLRSVCSEARSVVDDVASRVVDELQCVPRVLRESRTLAECAKARLVCLRYGFDPLLVEGVLATEPNDGRSLFTVARLRCGGEDKSLKYKRHKMRMISEVGYENASLELRRELDVRPLDAFEAQRIAIKRPHKQTLMEKREQESSPFAKLEAAQAPVDLGIQDWKTNGVLITGKQLSEDENANTDTSTAKYRMFVRGLFHVTVWVTALVCQSVILHNFEGLSDKDAENKTEGLYHEAFNFPKDKLEDLHYPLAAISVAAVVLMIVILLGLSAFYDMKDLKHFSGQSILFFATMGIAFSSAVQVYFLTMTATALKFDDESKTGEQDGDPNPYFDWQLAATFTTLGGLMTLYSYAATTFELTEFVPSLAWGFAFVFERILYAGYLEYDHKASTSRGEPEGPTWDHIKAMALTLWILNLIYVILTFLSKFYLGQEKPGTFLMGFTAKIVETKRSGPLVRAFFFTLVVVALTLSGLLYNFAANEWGEHSLGTSKYFSSGGRILALVIMALQFTMMKEQMDKSVKDQ